MKNLLIIIITITMFFFKNTSFANYEKVFFDFKINSVTGEELNLNNFRGKPVLVVNTASYCGFTNQYNELQELWEKYKDKGLIVLGVPSNSFNQEKKKIVRLKNFVKLILI
tara:strand:+ start:359 stop:691 length:333 start_codon:yes stop_codon:yes gene_type:complete